MKRCTLFSAATLTAAALLLTLQAPVVHAQRNGAQRGGFGGFGNPMMGGLNRGMMDPTMSNLRGLLQRNDVRTELYLTARQREALEELDKKLPAEMMEKFRNSKDRPDPQKMRDLSPEERQQKMQEFGQQMQTTMQNLNADIDKKIEGILKPEQMVRLRQLDLQMRGPLALANQELSEKVQIDQEQRTKLNEIMGEFRKAQGEAMRGAFSAFTGNRGNNPNGSAPNANSNGNAPRNNSQNNSNRQRQGMPSPEEFTKMAEEMMKKMDKSRQEYGEKVLEILSPEQADLWKKMQGKKFTFRVQD